MITESYKIKRKLRHRRRAAIRKKIRGTSERPRLVVFRSSKHIYAQIVDDSKGLTLCSHSDIATNIELTEKLDKCGKSFIVGEKLGQIALKAGITKVTFDRAGYKYHGRIKALAEGARKAGLQF